MRFSVASYVNVRLAPALSTSYWRVVALLLGSVAAIVSTFVPAPTGTDARNVSSLPTAAGAPWIATVAGSLTVPATDGRPAGCWLTSRFSAS